MRAIRTLGLIAIALIFALGGIALPARADATILPQLDVRVTAEPSVVTELGPVELQFTFENKGPGTLTGVILTSPDGVSTESLGDIAEDSYLTHSLTHTVTDAELSAGVVSYLVSLNAGDKRYNFPVEATIGRAIPATPVEFLRNVSSRFVASSGQLTVVYQARNLLSTPITGVQITDSLDGFSQSIDVVNPGETVNLVHSVAVTDIMVSAPTLSYDRANGTRAEIHLDDLAFRVAHPALNLEFNVETDETGCAQATLRLTNAGDVDFKSISIYDDLYGGVVADSLRLPLSSAPVEIAREYPVRESAAYRWRVVAVDAADETTELLTETRRVSISPLNETTILAVSAAPKWEKIRRAGYVPFEISIENRGSSVVTNVSISEASLGTVCTLAAVGPGEPVVWTERVRVAESREYRFSISYLDADGAAQTIEAEPVMVRIGSGGATPEESGANVLAPFTGSSMKVARSDWFIVVLILAVAVLVALTVVLLILSRRARRAQKERDAARRQRLHDELGKTAPFTPLKRLANKDRSKKDVSGIQ